MKYSEEEKAMFVEDWRGSGKSAWAYAKANGLNLQTFVKWTKPKEEKESASCFVEVPVPIAAPAQYSHEIVIEKGEIKIRIPLSLGYRELRALIKAMWAVV